MRFTWVLLGVMGLAGIGHGGRDVHGQAFA